MQGLKLKFFELECHVFRIIKNNCKAAEYNEKPFSV